MPVFEYVCNQCDNGFEEMIPYGQQSEEYGLRCPECGSKDVRKVINTSNVRPRGVTTNFGR